MGFLKYVIMVRKEDRKERLVISRPEKYGGNTSYNSYEQLEKDFIEKKLHPMDLKNALSKELNILLKPIRENTKLRKLYEQAYSS